MSSATPDDRDLNQTSLHVRQAGEGREESVAWVVARFSPLLRAQASYRLSGPLQRHYDPEDVANDVWLRVLPRLSSIEPRQDRFTPVLLSFLSTTLLRHVNSLLRKHFSGKPGRVEAGEDGESPVDRLSVQMQGAVTRAQEDETGTRINDCLSRLSTEAREVFVLRGIEQHSNREVARRLGLAESAVSMRYSRALERLRECLPASVFDEID